MLLPIKLICPKGKTRKDGTCIIFIQYCGSKTILLNTGIAIPLNTGTGSSTVLPPISPRHTAPLTI